jgi:hypothetical protein
LSPSSLVPPATRLRKEYRRIFHRVCSLLYRDAERELSKSIMLAGSGRSGTTWLAEIIASQAPSRLMFEPFHPGKVRGYRRFEYFQYMRPDDYNTELAEYCRAVFSGEIRNRWIDREVDHLFPRFRVIKDIRANLLLRWMHDRFPEVPLLFIIRHPAAVVLSRMGERWDPSMDLRHLLSQPSLTADFLRDRMEVIERAETVEAKHAVVWCIHNLVPLEQFRSSRLNVVFYENLCTQPEVEIPEIFRTAGLSYQASIFSQLNAPSATTKLVTGREGGEELIGRWRRRLSPSQIDNILAVVRGFGLDYLYDDRPAPLISALGMDHAEEQISA